MVKPILYRIIVFVTGWLFLLSVACAQHQELNEAPNLWGKSFKTGDSSSLLHSFQAGSLHGNFRSFFSSNFNEGITPEYAQAVGGGIQFRSKTFHHLNVGMSGYFVHKVFSSDLTRPNPIINTYNRYELGLFDITNPAGSSQMNRLEELFVRYQKKQFNLTIGKQLMNTPFINLQDGRMRPTIVQGVSAEYTFGKWKLLGSWINGFSPRSTFNWYSTGASIGLYSLGVNPDGTPSGYKNQLKSSGILLISAEIKNKKNRQWQIWNQLTYNIFNSTLFQFDQLQDSSSPFYYGIQLITQLPVNQGGHIDINKRYFPTDQFSLAFGGRIGKITGPWDNSINYTRITGHGRYLMPREWGRDPFFTFMMGERNEGLGDVHAISLKSKLSDAKNRFSWQNSAGYFDLPDVSQPALNKYGFPSYFQFNSDFRYTFSGIMRGWQAQLIYFYKYASGNTKHDPKYTINKVNMSHLNLILNFHF
jgi:hypothetical protein